jgi:hypothetical protein
MKDTRRVTPIVKKKEKKRGQCVVRKNKAINTQFLLFSWSAEHHRKKKRVQIFLHQKRGKNTKSPRTIQT